MRFVILWCVLSVGVLVASDETQGPCPIGEHHRPDCPHLYEPTCAEPTYRPLVGKLGRICKKPLCFCNEPTVRNADRKCVPLSECPSTS